MSFKPSTIILPPPLLVHTQCHPAYIRFVFMTLRRQCVVLLQLKDRCVHVFAPSWPRATLVSHVAQPSVTL